MSKMSLTKVEPLVLPHILHLPDAVYLNIVRHFDTLQEVWKFSSLHKILRIKMDRLVLSQARCLMLGTDGRYSIQPPPLPSLTRQNSGENSGGLKSIIRTPASGIGDTSPTPRQKYRVRFDLEDAVWSYAAPKLSLLTAPSAGLTRLGDCGGAADSQLPQFRRWSLCADRPSTSNAFNVFCSYVEDCSDMIDAPYIPPCTDLLHTAHRNLRELHIGPVKERRSGRALQKFLTHLTISDVTLQKLVLTYDGESEMYYQPPVLHTSETSRRPSVASDDGSLIRGNGFPSRAVNFKLLKLVRRNAKTLNAVKVYLDEEFRHWVSIERRTVDGVCSVYVEHKTPDCSTALHQALHIYFNAFRYEGRTLATQTFFKIWSPAEDLRSAATFMAMAAIACECMDDMRCIIGDLYVTDSEDPMDPTLASTITAQRRKKLLEALHYFISTDSILPYGLGQLETLEWRFHNVELTPEEFRSLCQNAKSFRSALTTFQIGNQAFMIASPAVPTRPKIEHRTFITVS